MNIIKALADENRVRTLLALRQNELCVCQITELLGLAPSTVSKHLSISSQTGLVESRKDGRWIYYKLPGRAAPVAVHEAIDWNEKSRDDTPQFLDDSKQLKKILKQDPTDLCKRQTQRWKPSILILCTGNSCRCHLAKGILRAVAGDIHNVQGTGSKPAGNVH